MPTVKVKFGPSGHVSATHPAAPLGHHGESRTVAIVDVPPGVSTADVVRAYAASIDLGQHDTVRYADLGAGRIIEW